MNQHDENILTVRIELDLNKTQVKDMLESEGVDSLLAWKEAFKRDFKDCTVSNSVSFLNRGIFIPDSELNLWVLKEVFK